MVATLQARARDGGHELHTIPADIVKAFQSVPHFAVEDALRRLGLPEEAVELMMETDYGWDDEGEQMLATCQVITGAGLSPSFEVENGIRQGMRCSPG